MARSGHGLPGWRVFVVWTAIALLLAGCGVPDDFPTPTPTPVASVTPTMSPTPIPTATVASTSTVAPENPTAATTPTIAATPSPLSLRPTATTTATSTPSVTSTPSDSESDSTTDQTVPGTATAFAPGPGPVATVVVNEPGATATGTPIATIEATIAPLPTATPTFVPEPTATATLVPEPTPTPDLCPGAIPWWDAINHLGTYGTVVGPVVAAYWAEESRGKPTFLNVGAPYPDPSRFTVLMWIDARWNFDFAPEEVYLGSTICVTGTIELYEGSAEMVIEGPEWIWVP